ncbi:S8 family serine peptidase [Thermophilibacter sp.]
MSDARDRGGAGPRVVIGVSLLVIVAAAVAVAALLLRGGTRAATDESLTGGQGVSPSELAEKSELVDVSPDGVTYMNNEILVYAADGADAAQLQELFSSVGASDVDDSLADLTLYRLVFSESLTYDDLAAKLDALNASPLVDEAMLDPVVSTGTDAEDDFQTADAAYPNDPWEGSSSSWDVSVPRGGNWGMEAIDAPGAWGYLDQLSTINVGLIDAVPNTDHEDLRYMFDDALIYGIDSKSSDVQTYTASSPEDHGSHVAGIMDADWNNDTGVSGVMGGKGRLYYCNAYYVNDPSYEQGYGTSFSYLMAIRHLVQNDVRAINISLNTSREVGYAASQGDEAHRALARTYLQSQADAVETGLRQLVEQRKEAGQQDFVICVAAGNTNGNYFRPDSSNTYGYRMLDPNEQVRDGDLNGGALAVYNNFLNLADDPEVMNRIIVVGAVGIDEENSTSGQTRYEYAYYSNDGSRIDVVAPGGTDKSQVYSCVTSGYNLKMGTSMATPHVTGVAGLVFAANPDLSGPDVKRIVVASAEGRYYHGTSYSGLVNARTAVESALRTRDESVSRVVTNTATNGLDLCFVVDTTGSMGDDIENARQNMEQILASLAERTENYRVALVDYRDFSSRTHDGDDYPCRVELNFTNDTAAITRAINDLDLGYGGDDEETVYSGLMQAVNLGWRDDAKKVIIVLGDAAPLDPEPVTGYTYGDVLAALYNGGIGIDYTSSDERVLGEPDESLINVFSIGADASSDAMDFFEGISSSTGGTSADLSSSSEVSDAITASIDQIEVEAGVTAELDFGSDMAGARVDLYAASGDPASDGGETSAAMPEAGTYLFSFTTDGTGTFTVEGLPAGDYVWTTDGAAGGGTLSVATGGAAPDLRAADSFWFAPIMRAWDRGAPLFVCTLLLVVAACVAAPLGAAQVARSRAGRGGNASGGTSGNTSDGGGGFCPHCGTPLAPGARFCRNCGHRL